MLPNQIELMYVHDGVELYPTPHHLTFVLAPLLDCMLVHDYGPLPSSKKLLYVFLYDEMVTCSSYHSDSSVVAGAIELLGDKVLIWFPPLWIIRNPVLTRCTY